MHCRILRVPEKVRYVTEYALNSGIWLPAWYIRCPCPGRGEGGCQPLLSAQPGPSRTVVCWLSDCLYLCTMSDSFPQQRPLKVLIVGGGIAGLTLANALEQAPVDFEYIVLESRDHLTPQLGAGIALLPHGSRILDQLGVYAELESQVVPVASSGVLNARGQPLLSERSDTAQLVTARMSYPLGWVERRSVLMALAGHLRRKSCILTDKKVRAVEQTEDKGVTVHCTDGSSYRGDIVVGADGVRSTVRSEMWREMEEHGNGKIDVGKERRGEQIEG